MSKQATGSGVAQSAQAGFHNKRDAIDGLHSSRDPDPQQMTHSAAFDNYKRHGGGGAGNSNQKSHHAQNQSTPNPGKPKQQLYQIEKQGEGPGGGPSLSGMSTTLQESHYRGGKQQLSQIPLVTSSPTPTQRSLSHVVTTAGQNVMTSNKNTDMSTVFDRAARQYKALAN